MRRHTWLERGLQAVMAVALAACALLVPAPTPASAADPPDTANTSSRPSGV